MTEDLDLAAASYVLGLLRGEERATVEGEIARDDVLRARVDLWQRHFIALDLAAPGETPPPDLYDSLRAALDGAAPEIPRTATLRSGAGPWIELAPGVTCRILFDDPVTKRRSMLIRALPGASLDAHSHDNGPEECLVLEGDLVLGDLVLHAGDFHVAYAQSAHPRATTRTGCLVYLSAAL